MRKANTGRDRKHRLGRGVCSPLATSRDAGGAVWLGASGAAGSLMGVPCQPYLERFRRRERFKRHKAEPWVEIRSL
jgi:hypothetical protein